MLAFWGKKQAAGSGFVNKPFNGFQSRKNLWGYFLLKLQPTTLRRTRVGSGILKGVKMSTTFVTLTYCMCENWEKSLFQRPPRSLLKFFSNSHRVHLEGIFNNRSVNGWPVAVYQLTQSSCCALTASNHWIVQCCHSSVDANEWHTTEICHDKLQCLFPVSTLAISRCFC